MSGSLSQITGSDSESLGVMVTLVRVILVKVTGVRSTWASGVKDHLGYWGLGQR